jgi:hypothetical protein
LSKTRVQGLSAGASTCGVSKPCEFDATIVTVAPDATGPPDVCGAPDPEAAGALPDGAAEAGAPEAGAPDAPGEPDAATDGAGVFGGAGAYVQPGVSPAQPTRAKAVAARRRTRDREDRMTGGTSDEGWMARSGRGRSM